MPCRLDPPKSGHVQRTSSCPLRAKCGHQAELAQVVRPSGNVFASEILAVLPQIDWSRVQAIETLKARWLADIETATLAPSKCVSSSRGKYPRLPALIVAPCAHLQRVLFPIFPASRHSWSSILLHPWALSWRLSKALALAALVFSFPKIPWRSWCDRV